MTELQQLEAEIFEKITKLQALRKAASGVPVRNYSFQTLDGSVSLLDLFAGRDSLLVIHNMGA